MALSPSGNNDDIRKVRELLRGPSVFPRKEHRRYTPSKMPKNRWSYIRLICGHVTTPEIQEVYSYWKPERGLNYCEHCGTWERRKPSPKESIPDEPPF